MIYITNIEPFGEHWYYPIVNVKMLQNKINISDTYCLCVDDKFMKKELQALFSITFRKKEKPLQFGDQIDVILYVEYDNKTNDFYFYEIKSKLTTANC